MAHNNTHSFKCNVAAKEMTDKISARIVLSDGRKTDPPYEYTVREYADALLANIPGNVTEQQKRITRAMLNYGAMAQQYFNNSSASPANVGLSDIPTKDRDTIISELSQVPPKTVALNDNNITFYGSTLSLESEIELVFFFDSADDITFYHEGAKLRNETRSGYKACRVSGIRITDLDKPITVNVKKNGTDCGSVTFSPLNHCYDALTNTSVDQNWKEVIAALYVYYIEAAAKAD